MHESTPTTHRQLVVGVMDAIAAKTRTRIRKGDIPAAVVVAAAAVEITTIF